MPPSLSPIRAELRRIHRVPLNRAPGHRSCRFGWVIVGAFLAESASVVDNKLSVSGGVLFRYAVEPDRSAHFLLVVLTQTETGTPDRRVEVEIRPPTNDEPLLMEFELPEVATAAEVGFAIFGIEVKLPSDGRWVLLVSGGTGAISLPLLVSG